MFTVALWAFEYHIQFSLCYRCCRINNKATLNLNIFALVPET